jgi:uncharacterized protein (DUF1501 family)
MTPVTRRDLLKHAAAAAAVTTGGLLLPQRMAFAAVGQGDARLVIVMLRGALDGLSVVPPVGDPGYAALRRQIALPHAGAEGGVLALDGTFGLHPSLSFLSESWQAKQLTVLQAVATPYRERSHFDGQDVLESGYLRPHAAQTGWLNRALMQLPGSRQRDVGIALGANIPLLMRGPAAVASWSPSKLAQLDDDTLQRIGDLYASDGLLSRRLADALSADAIAKQSQADEGDAQTMAGAGLRGVAAQYTETVQAAAGFLRRPDGPRVAVFDTTGWDTHANEGAAQGQLAQRLKALDSGLRTLRDSLGPVWQQTAVLVVTEFGRTAAINGTGGTDHGTGAAAFLLGGAVRGGRILADWPGLSASALYEGRDLRPTTDLRSVFKTVLRDHLAVPQPHIESQVFPDSKAAPYVADLMRNASA